MRRGKTPTVQEIVHALGEKLLQYPAKVHYRIVYKEVGKTIDQLDSMHDVFRCLCDIVKGLYAMHAAGYVHRDISAGNILVVDGKGRLGDVEYAKEEGDNSQHEVRTGTAYFMAIEVDEHAYVHTTTVKPLQLNVEPNILEDDSDSDSDSDDIPGGQADDVLPTYTANSDTKHTATSSHLDTIAEEDSESESSQQGQGDWVVDLSPQPEFQYNPLHDLESVWWVAVYVWLCSFPIRNDPKMDQTAWNEKLTAHARLAARVFHEVSFRRSFLTSEKILTTHSAALLPSFRAIGVHLEVIRATLMATYLHVEKDLSTLDFRAAKYAYTDILKSLTTVQKSLAGEKDIRIAFTDTRAMDAYLGGKPAHPNIIDAVNDTNLNNSEDADDDNGNSRPSKLFKSQHSRTVSLGAASSARWL
ncbi:hypothetical protein PHLGIDRAFT_402742 [Phlebiopsis gigantea 11061_1 CR5-6]|uniref:Protein kinase domain-containing protein n=1 Tax=Phlebiopsis gigantea (strain 11061_1 CR5-6) TaxID=745531 RepID=A0A0C3N9C2_PHLG1|nr:hypothetical protein PHLGIDRAFT_402742 [Phlebiopsis gigantea 11061_1 CR5-6]